jgi:type IV pilus assembly protein PilA
MLNRIRKTQEEREGGFTLIELLVVVIIIGILAAIAIPTFLNQREKAWTGEAKSDLRNAATVMEEKFSDDGTYANVVAGDFKLSDNVTSITPTTQTATAYCLDLVHAKLQGAASTWHFDSAVGKPESGTC